MRAKDVLDEEGNPVEPPKPVDIDNFVDVDGIAGSVVDESNNRSSARVMIRKSLQDSTPTNKSDEEEVVEVEKPSSPTKRAGNKRKSKPATKHRNKKKKGKEEGKLNTTSTFIKTVRYLSCCTCCNKVMTTMSPPPGHPH